MKNVNAEKFKAKLGPIVDKIENQHQLETSSGLRPLAELLVRWYKRRLAEIEANSFDTESKKQEGELL